MAIFRDALLSIGGIDIYETMAITHYINRKYGDDKYSPSDVMMQTLMYQIISIVDSYLHEPAIGTIVIQRLIVPQQGGEIDEKAVQGAISPVKKSLEAIEKLFVSTPYLVGSLISLADFYVIPIFTYLSKTKEFEAVTANTPKLRVWWEQVKTLNSVKQVCA